MIENFYEITEDGELLSPDWGECNVGENFQIKKVIGAQWECNGKKVELKYADATVPMCISVYDVVIVTEKSSPDILDDELVVYEADGSERFRVSVPTVSEYSKPEKAHFYWTEFNDATGEVTQVLNDGTSDYRAKLNVQTGELSDFVQTRV